MEFAIEYALTHYYYMAMVGLAVLCVVLILALLVFARKWAAVLWLVPFGIWAIIKGGFEGFFDDSVDTRRIDNVRLIRNGESHDWVEMPANVTYTLCDLPIIVQMVMKLNNVYADDLLLVRMSGSKDVYSIRLHTVVYG